MRLSADEAVAVRDKLGLSVADLAHELGLTPNVVEAWERGSVSVPSKLAKELKWREAVVDRQRALVESGLAECDWMAAWESEPVPDKLETHTAHLERALNHQKSCEICQAREKFARERFGEMPARPMAWWMRGLAWIASRAEKLPEWAQPAVWVGLAFGFYSVVRIIFFLPSIRSNPSLILTALQGLVASVSIGAAVGLIYGAFRLLKSRWRARAT
jgi:transcriptional regulator with XRE-family HTH domain